MILIGVGFVARSGKDTVGQYLATKYGFRQTAFAESLKNACREVFGFSNEQLYGSEKETEDSFWKCTPRWALQFVGTELFRQKVDPDVWVKSMQRRISNEKATQRWVITDVRFPNEAEAIQSWGGEVIRIDRPGVAASGGIAGHASETSLIEWDGWDHILKNDGTLEELYRKVDQLAKEKGWMEQGLNSGLESADSIVHADALRVQS